MFKNTKVRQILELLHKDLSAREISKTLNVSRNSVAFVKESYDKCDKDCQKEQHFIQHKPSGLEGYFSALPEKALFCGLCRHAITFLICGKKARQT